MHALLGGRGLPASLTFTPAPPTGRVFVTYEADNEKHVNDVINFAALLRHNGFDTHVRKRTFGDKAGLWGAAL